MEPYDRQSSKQQPGNALRDGLARPAELFSCVDQASLGCPASNASGAAAVRQTEQLTAAPHEEQPEVEERAARVAELREQHQRGTYQVDPAALSADIVSKHLKK